VVKDIDRFEMCLCASGYESERLNLSEFFDGVQGKIIHPVVAAWQDIIVSQRQNQKTKIGLVSTYPKN